MLAAEHITYKVGNSILLDDVSAQFEEGRLHLIIGPNGAGKTTFLKTLCKQLVPQSGSVLYDGKNLKQISELALARFRGVLSQSNELVFPLRVWEVVIMGRYPHFAGKPSAKDEQACKEAMKLLEIWELAERNYQTLSGGEKQRVQFARVLAQIWYAEKDFNRCLILDEPLTFLDVHYQYQLMHILTEFIRKEKLLVVGVLHDLNLAARFADHLLLMNKGKIIARGTAEQVLTTENIKDVFRLDSFIGQSDITGKKYIVF